MNMIYHCWNQWGKQGTNVNKIMNKNTSKVIALTLVLGAASGCATTSSKVVETPTVNTYNTQYTGEKKKLVVGQFVNRSSFQNGIFSNGQDRLGSQAKTTLMSHLQQTNRFSVLDRDNMNLLAEEAQRTGTEQKISGAKFDEKFNHIIITISKFN